MLVDINDGFWIDMPDDDPIRALYELGFSSQVTIMTTDFAKECKMNISKYECRKYVAIYEGCGITFDEMRVAYESNFTDVPSPVNHPIIAISDDLDKLKEMSVFYLTELYHAMKPGKKDWERRMKREEEDLSKLVSKFYNIFSIKNELN